MESKSYSLTCLYQAELPKIDFDAVKRAIADDVHLSDFAPSVVTRLPSKLVSYDFNGQFTVQILIETQPLDPQTFAIALLGAKTTTIKNDFAKIVERHRGSLSVTAIPADGAKETLEQRLIRIYALQMVTEYLYKFAKPDLLYSSMAESLVRPSLNPRSYMGMLDRRIFEQAVLFSRRGGVVAGQSIGANVWGGEDLVGKPVVFKQVDFPSWAITKGSTLFFAYCDTEGVPEEDCEFSDKQNFERYAVRITEPTANHPNGTIEVTIEKNLRAQERNPDGSPMFPELLGAANDPLRIDDIPRRAKRETEASKLRRFMILVVTLGVALGIATFAAYWRSSGNG